MLRLIAQVCWLSLTLHLHNFTVSWRISHLENRHQLWKPLLVSCLVFVQLPNVIVYFKCKNVECVWCDLAQPDLRHIICDGCNCTIKTFHYPNATKGLPPRWGFGVICTQPYPCNNKEVVFDGPLMSHFTLVHYNPEWKNYKSLVHSRTVIHNCWLT